jgi:VanZ family protein
MKYRKTIVRDPWLIGWAVVLAGVTVGSIFPSISPPHMFDKGLHLIIYLLLTIIPLARIEKREFAFLVAGCMPVLGFIFEYMQRNIRGREFSPEDMIANNIGAIAGIVIGIFFRLIMRFKRIQGRDS